MDQNERRQKMAANGVFRIKNGGGEDGVWISAGRLAFEIPESRYRQGRYRPSLETLPWGKAPAFFQMSELKDAETTVRKFEDKLHKLIKRAKKQRGMLWPSVISKLDLARADVRSMIKVTTRDQNDITSDVWSVPTILQKQPDRGRCLIGPSCYRSRAIRQRLPL